MALFSKILLNDVIWDTLKLISYRVGTDRPWGLTKMHLYNQKWKLKKRINPKQDTRFYFDEDQTGLSENHPDINFKGNIVVFKNGLLGSGGYGNVYRAAINQADGTVIPVALKIAKRKVKLDRPSASFIHELLVYWDNSSNPECSPHMLCVLGAFFVQLTDCDPDEYYECIVFERMDGDLDDLADAAASLNLSVDSKMHLLAYMMLHMTYDVYTMHVYGYIHIDIKPTNFLYKYDADKGVYRIKISDMGMACTFDQTKLDRIRQKAEATKNTLMDITPLFRYTIDLGCNPGGTLWYMSPDMKDLYLKDTSNKALDDTYKQLALDNDIYALAMSCDSLQRNLQISSTDLLKYANTAVLNMRNGDFMSAIAAENYFVRNKIPLPVVTTPAPEDRKIKDPYSPNPYDLTLSDITVNPPSAMQI